MCLPPGGRELRDVGCGSRLLRAFMPLILISVSVIMTSDLVPQLSGGRHGPCGQLNCSHLGFGNACLRGTHRQATAEPVSFPGT